MLASKLISPTGKTKTLPPIRPNAGITAAYRRKLDDLIAQMNADITATITAQYDDTPPELAMDKSPAASLNEAFKRLAARWERQFDNLAPAMAKHFAKSAAERSDASLQAALRKGGMTVKFRMTRAQNDAVQASVAENVQLIKSIAQQHLTGVQSLVMQSVSLGRDMSVLSKGLQAHYGVTRRRAALIARDQNEKATAALNRVRQLELGITEALWVHSTAGRHPRPSHVAASGKKYDVAKGMYLDGVFTWPGREINCRCSSRSIIKAFS